MKLTQSVSSVCVLNWPIWIIWRASSSSHPSFLFLLHSRIGILNFEVIIFCSFPLSPLLLSISFVCMCSLGQFHGFLGGEEKGMCLNNCAFCRRRHGQVVIINVWKIRISKWIRVRFPVPPEALFVFVMRDSTGWYRTKKTGGLVTSVILPRESWILEEGAAAHAWKQWPVPCAKNTSYGRRARWRCGDS